MSNIEKLFGSFEDEDNPAHVDWGDDIGKEDPELSPGHPELCAGNVDSERCCDECDHFLLCFPEFGSDPSEPSSQE